MVIPIHDENPLRRRPVVTWLLVLINVALFLAEPIGKVPMGNGTQTLASACQQIEFFDHYGAIPKELTSNQQLAPHVVGPIPTNVGPLPCPTERWSKVPALSVLTAMFLHAGWAHLLGNMLFFIIFGNNIEDRLGRIRFLLFYLVAGYVAAYGYALASPHSTAPLIGASGAIAGVLGAYVVLYPRARVTALVPFLLFLPFRLPAWLVLGFWFLLQYAYSAGNGVAQGADVAYFAHVVGFLFGALLIRLIVPRGRAALRTER
ncbi:MAG TPA: rhomboid family intramembrane serine protease [Acidimicrobiales bacterium]|nr:rhomboid family intramembrane serine protease [Acidimicrobiales bacterium]